MSKLCADYFSGGSILVLSLLKPLIVNITILFSLTFNTNLLLLFNDKKPLTMPKKILYGIISAFGALLCMLYPIETLGETNFDLRMVLILVTTIYGGLLVGFICTLPVIIFRFFIGGEFMVIGILISLFAFMVAALFRNSFFQAKNRYIYSILIFGVYFILYLFMIYTSIDFLQIEFYFIYFFVFFLSFISLIFIIEKMIVVNKQIDETIYLDKLSTIGQMAASFAHEIRNPLTTVRGFIQYLEKDTNDINLKKFAPLILDELDRTNKIITNYLQLTKTSKLKITEINLAQVLIDTIEMLRPLGTFRNVMIDLKLDAHYFVYGDEQYLKQSLLNVIKNGIEAIESRGAVIVSTILDTINENVVIVVEDNGRGMTEEELKKIGLPFYTTKTKGTGLGSMVTNRLIREMNGKIEYESKPAKGTKVEITLPLIKK